MKEQNLTLEDLYNKVGLLVFAILFLIFGLLFNQVEENDTIEIIKVVLFIFSYFCFVALFVFFLGYFLNKFVIASKSMIAKIISKILNLYNQKRNVFMGFTYIIIALPILAIILYYKKWEGFIDVVLGPFCFLLLVGAYKYFKKHSEKKNEN